MKANLLVMLFLGGLVTPINAAPSIIPQPTKIVEKPGSFTLEKNVAIIGPRNCETAVFAARELSRSTGFKLSLALSTDSPSISFSLDPKVGSLGDEGYRLFVAKGGVVIRAATEAGLFNGFQTLRQLFPPEIYATEPIKRTWTVPCVEIEDSPRFRWRGAMLDVARHFMPKEDVKRFIDLMSIHKLNSFHWHLTDDQGWRIEIKKYPKLTEVGAWRKETLVGRYPAKMEDMVFDGVREGGFYTQDDIREVVAYAAERHVTIVPEIEMPGHAQAAIAAYPWLGNATEKLEPLTYWGVNPNVYNTSDRTIQFQKDVLDEVMTLFPGEFIHVGGDECPKDQWKTSAEAQARIKALNLKDEHELQSWFIRQIDAYIASKHKRLIGWDEILEGGLAPGAAVMSWRGTEGGIAAAKAGHDVVMSPTSYCYLDYAQSRNTATEPITIGGFVPISKVYEFNPVPEGFTKEEAKHVLGAQGNIWTEYMRDAHKVDYMAFPRLCAMAEVVWTAQADRNFDNFMARLPEHLLRLDQREVNYRALDSAGPSGEVIGGWKTGDAKNDYSELKWPIQDGFSGPGKYVLTFQYMSGGCRLDVEWVEILAGGQVVARVEHHGITGNFNKDNTYDLDLSSVPAGSKLELRARVRADGGDDSNGLIYLKKM
jgi:hexosaminidase